MSWSVLRRTLTLAAMLAAGALAAAPLPNVATDVAIVARDRPVGAFLGDLFGRAGQPVVASDRLAGTVNGSFHGPAGKIFDGIAKAFNLVGYYDGAAVYVYSAAELGVKTLPVGPARAARVLRQVRFQRLADTHDVVRASADGTLVASGTPRFIEQVSGLADGGGELASVSGHGPLAAASPPPAPQSRPAYGAAAQPLEFRVFYLRYAHADDTTVDAGGRELRIPGIATIVQNLVLDRQPPRTNFGSYPIRQSGTRLKGQGLDSIRPNVSQTPLLGLPVGGFYPVGPGTQPPAAPADDGTTAAPLTSDVVRIQANPLTNSVIVRDVPERMNAYDGLIRALDVEPQMVELEATVVDIDTDKLRQLGINWRLNTGGFGALFGSGQSTDQVSAPTTGLNAITQSVAGGAISAIIGPQREFLARVTALEIKNAARIVSRPEVMTLSDNEAVFDRTQTFYVRVAGREEVDLFNVTAGMVLRVTPHVFRDHDQTRIRMLINIEDGQLNGRASVDNIPIVERASVSTQAMVLDGQSLLLGGMTADQDTNAVTKVPVLGDIPLLGNLFKLREKYRSHTERLFLITPRLATLSAGTGPVTVSRSTQAAQAFRATPSEKLP